MHRQFLRNFKKRFGRKYNDINPEDIFIDSENLPGFESHRFEGRMEKPVGEGTFLGAKIVLAIVILALVAKLFTLGVKDRDVYAQISENNRLEKSLIFANRGIILDRHGQELATNETKNEGDDFALRHYATSTGLSHVLGYVRYPMKDKNGYYYDTNYVGKEGVERAYDDILRGVNGTKLRETDAHGKVTSESVVEEPVDGKALALSIDARVTEMLYKGIENLARERGFVGGAGVIIDINTGELLALTSYPEYSLNLMTGGGDKDTINALLTSNTKPFLNRAIGGLYTPGSILKPVIALAALNEKLISPNKEILSTGSISVPNPYDPSKPSIFRDWKAHGYTAMREAIAVSSDVYFYTIGGGYGDQKGLGISLLDQYLRQFRITEKTGIELGGEIAGVIPTPEWKKEKFNGDIWRLGDTYITAIGQFGTQITPLSAARMIATIANRGKIVKPSLLKGGLPEPIEGVLDFQDSDWQVIHEGMRESVTYGTSAGLNVPYVKAAGKTGTAEVGAAGLYVNSWSVGFFPYDNPRYAWAVVMERGPSTNTLGATSVMRSLFDWMSIYAPEYFQN